MSTININVKHLNHNTHKVTVPTTHTVAQLKQELEKVANIKASELKLIFKGKVLKKPEETLADLNITEGCTLHMIHTPAQTES